MGIALIQPFQTYPAQALGDPFAALLRCLPAQCESHVLGHGQMGEQGVFLKHHTEPPAFRRQLIAGAGHFLAADMDVAGLDRFQPGHRSQGGGLAAAAGPQQTGDPPFLQGETDAVHGAVVTVLAGQIGNGQQRLGHGPRYCQCWPWSRNSNSAFCACRRFSASSQTTERGSSSMSWLISSPRWAGRQCMNSACSSARSISAGVT